MSFWTAIPALIKESDVILVICDARVPELSRNIELEEKVNRYKKKVMFVFNKIDLISREHLDKIKVQHPDALFVSVTKKIGIGDMRRKLLMYGSEHKIFPLKVGLVGYPNVGKSSIINFLARGARAHVSPVAGTTKGYQFIKVSKNLKVIDSPGVIDFRDGEAKLGIISAKNPEKMKNPEKTAAQIIDFALKSGKTSISQTYGVETEGKNAYDILESIGRRKGMLKKGGEVDEIRSAVAVIRDWQRGKIKIN